MCSFYSWVWPYRLNIDQGVRLASVQGAIATNRRGWRNLMHVFNVVVVLQQNA